jgi:flagellar L-ring protein precursor FlgH
MKTPSKLLFRGALGSLIFLGASLEIHAQSLWKEGKSVSIVADKRAHAVGDLITILVQENNTATKANSTQTSKQTGLDAKVETFFYSPTASGLLTQGGQMPALKASSKTEFEGGGRISNSEKITARIAARVLDVLPNSTLVIEGRRAISFGGETQEAVIRGVVRVEDIAANNTIYSYHVADVNIKYSGKGPVSDSQRKGWFTKIWDKLTPF